MKKVRFQSNSKIKVNVRFITGVVLAVFAVVQLFLTLQTVSSGAKLASLEQKEEDLTKENKELTLQLVEASSLTKLSEKAIDFGFAKPQSTVYLTQEENVAKLP